MWWLSEAAGTWALVAAGSFLVVLIGVLGALRRPLGPSIALFVPVMIIGVGGTFAAFELEHGWDQLQSDPGAPGQVAAAIGTRARAGTHLMAAGWGSAMLLFPLIMGASMGSVRGARRQWAPLTVTALPVLAGVSFLALGTVAFGEPVLLGVPTLLLAALFVAGELGLAGDSGRPVAALGLTLGTVAVLLGAHGYASARLLPLVDDIAAIENRFAGLPDRLLLLHLGILPVAVGPPAGWLSARTRRLRGLELLGPAVLSALLALALLPWVWVSARRAALAEPGRYIAAILDQRPQDLPRRGPMPGRVLVSADRAWWVTGRDGPVRSPLAAPFADSGAEFNRTDGLMLDPDLVLEDFYYFLSEVNAGQVALVGCKRPSSGILAVAPREPLVLIGACGSFILQTRVTEDLLSPRGLIVLADRMVDEGGDVGPVENIKVDPGVSVIVRGQLDATVGDLHALLRRLGDAGTVYLGWGVRLDGTPFGVGIDPDLRIRTKAAASSLDSAAPATPPAPADLPGS